jgi:hypothetical protein
MFKRQKNLSAEVPNTVRVRAGRFGFLRPLKFLWRLNIGVWDFEKPAP